MKSKLITSALILLTLSNTTFAKRIAKYEVSIQNLTKGQPLTPAAIIIHNKSFNLFKLGSSASKGLYMLAEDGIVSELQKEVEGKNLRLETLTGLTLPGKINSTIIEAKNMDRISIASMLAKTNDGFVSSRTSFTLDLRKGQSYSRLLYVFDAGSEINNELKSFIPAYGSGGIRTHAREGFVSFHPGFQGIGDSDLQTVAFAPQAAKITIKRIK